MLCVFWYNLTLTLLLTLANLLFDTKQGCILTSILKMAKKSPNSEIKSEFGKKGWNLLLLGGARPPSTIWWFWRGLGFTIRVVALLPNHIFFCLIFSPGGRGFYQARGGGRWACITECGLLEYTTDEREGGRETYRLEGQGKGMGKIWWKFGI